MSQSYNIDFNPIQCTSNVFKNLYAQEGFLYFVTDTKQLYLGKDGEFLNMCGGLNIHYGTKEIEYENSGQAPDPNVTFQLFDLEKREAPLVGDLILNTDGCFYKVDMVADEGITTTRVTLQGSGGGGGGSVTGGSSDYSINVNAINIFSAAANNMKLSFKATAPAGTSNYINHIAFTLGAPLSETNLPFYEFDGYYEFGTIEEPKEYFFDLIDYKHLFGSTAITVYINTTDAYGAPRNKKFSVQTVDISLSEQKPVIFKSNENNYSYSCIVGGAKTGITDKKIVFEFFNEDNLNVAVYTQEKSLMANEIGAQQASLNLSSLSHGVYVLKVHAEATIPGNGQVIPSNTLTHKVICFATGSSNALLAIVLPDRIEQYTNIPMHYLLASQEEGKKYTLNISIDTVKKPSQIITTNTLGNYTLYFEERGTYTLTVDVAELGGLEQVFNLEVIEYNGKLPVIDPADETLMLYLTPKGLSNNSTEKHLWRDYNGRYAAQLSDMYYGNVSGWLEDADGTSYLQLISGGKLSLPDFHPFENDPTIESNLNSAMGQGMTIELDFEINGVTDYNAELIKCISTNSRLITQVGFSITGNKVKFYNSSKNGHDGSGSVASLNLVEGKRTRLSFVIEPNNTDFPMVLTYLNGIISGASIYSKSDSFVDSSYKPATLEIDSTYAQIKIYGIRFYSVALNDRNILRNYTATLPTLDERQSRFETNEVYNEDNKIDYKLVSAENYDLQIPYMLITGGWATDAKNDKWKMLPSDKIGQAGLPTGKKDYRLIDVSVVYPKNDYFRNYKNYTYKNVFENGLGLQDNFGNKPVGKTGCIMYAQGTSSMEYPVKNLRLRFRDKNHHFQVRPDLSPVEIICMKADYMESSGSHNTGAANLIDDLYEGASLKTPGQEHFGPNSQNPDRKKIVTCIKGHPCLIFYRTSEQENYEYVGKYNLNLDKATPEPFGFNHDDSNFGYLSPGESYYAIQYDDDGTKFIGQESPAMSGDYDDTKENEEVQLKQVEEGQKINSIHCFEFLDNAVPVCNFLKKPKKYVENEFGELIPDPTGGYYTFKETWYNTFQNKELEDVPGWALGFESRYPEDRIGYHDADMLYPMAKWLSDLYYLKTEGSSGTGIPSQKDIDEANARFKNEYEVYFNKDFLLFYYIVTETLLMADSRVKNMMIATWGKHNYSYYPLKYDIINTETEEYGWIADTTQEPIQGTSYLWYPIFYDMDTMLGLDNTGASRFNYYDEDTDPSIYNGEEVLWNFVRDNLARDLDLAYRDLESAGLNIDIEADGSWKPTSIIPYFNKNQANMANEAFYNGDAKYKYIDPAVEGYFDGLNNMPIDPGAAPYLYAAQGDRSIMRDYFITNRVKFLRGKHNSNRFQNNDRITFRWYYPSGLENDFNEIKSDGTVINHSNSVTAVPPSNTFDFTSLQTCYAGVLLGANGNVIKERFDGEQLKHILVEDADAANGTEAYLLGASGLKDLGDLSNKYVQKFIMNGENKLSSLIFGNPHKDYYNPFWRTKEGNTQAIGISGCKYLKLFNLQNCSTYNAEVDFSNCPIIETILLTGSRVTGITLPVNGNLQELRLPTSITYLNINSHPNLTAEKFSIGDYTYGTTNKIGENDGGHYNNDYGYLTEICIANTPIDTYDIITQAVSLEGYYLEGFNWEILGTTQDNQYVITKDLEPMTGKKYYLWDESITNYRQATSEECDAHWGIIREEIKLINSDNEITSVPILEQLLTKTPRKDKVGITRESALSGTITIKARAKINQFNLYQKYNRLYPNVNIVYDEAAIGAGNLTKAYKIEFFNTINVTEENEAYQIIYTDGSYTLEQLMSPSGPAGMALPVPAMQSTNTIKYEFTGEWKIVGTNTVYDIRQKPTQDLKLEPIYNEVERKYTIKFYNHLEQQIETVEYSYLQVMKDNIKTPVYLNRDDSDLEEFERYTFKGWISEKDFKNNVQDPAIIDISKRQVAFDMSLYPYYIIEDARKVATDLKYFDIREEKITFNKTIYLNDGSISSNENISLGTQLVLYILEDPQDKDRYRKSLGGKITLPSKDKNGRDITVVALDKLEHVTEVYFLENNKYISIGKADGNLGLYSCVNLRRVYFPANMNSLKYIGNNGFRLNSNLFTLSLPDSIEYIGTTAFRNSPTEILNLPSSLTYIATSGFLNATGVKAKQIPLGLTQIPSGAFSVTAMEVAEFGRDVNNQVMAELENNIQFIGENAFSGVSCPHINTITLNNSIKYLGAYCFDGYGSSGSITVIDRSGLVDNENKAIFFGNSRTINLQKNS